MLLSGGIMSLSTYCAPLYLIDEVEDLIRLNYSENSEIRPILEEFKADLELIHNFTRKLVDFENGRVDTTEILKEYFNYKVGKIRNLSENRFEESDYRIK